MRKCLLTLALLLWATTADAAWTLVQTRTACPTGCDVTDDWTNATGVGGQIIVTGLTTTTTGNTLVIYAQAGNDSRTVSSVSCGDTATALHTEYGTRMAYIGAVVVATPGAGFTTSFPVGFSFSTALTCWLVTGAADSDVAEVAANEIMVFYSFK